MVLWAAGLFQQFSKHDRIAGLLLLPYILWLYFAFYLNTTILLFN